MKVLYIPYKDASFVRADKEILESFASVETLRLEWVIQLLIPFSFVVQFFWLLIRVPRADVVVCSFANYSSVLPAWFGKVFGKRVVIVVHGTECAAIPTINYGMSRKLLLRKCIGSSLRLCDKVVISNEKLVASKDTYSNGIVGNQGLSEYYNIPYEKYQVIPYDLDAEFWETTDAERTKNSFVSVILPGQELRRDLGTIYHIAEHFPEYTFRIVGLEKSNGEPNQPTNVHLLGTLSSKQLREEFNKVDFFLQLSLYEGFGLSLAEAMLCGCIPIASSVNVVPEIVGEMGFMIASREDETIFSIIEKAVIESENVNRSQVRKRIIDRYPFGSRKESLSAMTNSLMA